MALLWCQPRSRITPRYAMCSRHGIPPVLYGLAAGNVALASVIGYFGGVEGARLGNISWHGQ